MFEHVPNEQFDQVFANGPFLEGEIIDPMDYACYGAKQFIEKVFEGLQNFLKKKGKLLIVLASWVDLNHFQETAKRNGFIATMNATRNSDDGERIYQLYQVTKI